MKILELDATTGSGRRVRILVTGDITANHIVGLAQSALSHVDETIVECRIVRDYTPLDMQQPRAFVIGD